MPNNSSKDVYGFDSESTSDIYNNNYMKKCIYGYRNKFMRLSFYQSKNKRENW